MKNQGPYLNLDQMPFRPEEIKRRLARPLPGSDAQYRMAPSHRPGPEFALDPPANAREAAVLILLYPDPRDLLQFVMMLRPGNSGPHSGQISFPGGGREASDQNLLATALRESFEEMAICPERVRILGELSRLYVSPSRYLVAPFVGYCAERPDFISDTIEVEEILEFSLVSILIKSNRREGPRQVRHISSIVPYFQFGEHQIWGASAMILAELAEVLDDIA